MSVLVVKMMSSEDMPDSSPYKGFKLISVPPGGEVTFGKSPDDDAKDVVFIYVPGAAETAIYEMTGNVYVLNENGKTVASRGTINNNSEDALKEFGERLGSLAREATEKLFAYADSASLVGNKTFLASMQKFLLNRIEVGDHGALRVVSELYAAIPKDQHNLTELGRVLGKMEFGDVTQVLWHAGNFCTRDDSCFIAAVGEYLATLLAKNDEEAIPVFARLQAVMAKNGGWPDVNMPFDAEGVGKRLGQQPFGIITEALWHASVAGSPTNPVFVKAMGEFLANLVGAKKDDWLGVREAGREAVRYAYEHIGKELK